MQNLGVLQALSECAAIETLFVGPPAPLDAESMKNVFRINYSVAGSTRRHAEEIAVGFFWDWLSEVEGMRYTWLLLLMNIIHNQ